MLDHRVCPQCGKSTTTTLACEHCGYLFHTLEGEVEIALPGAARMPPLRMNLRGLLIAGGVLVLSMCLCPQLWFYGAELLDRGLGIKGVFWSFGNGVTATMLVCPVIYAGLLAMGLAIVWRSRSRY
jgi:hypothetical protein